LALSIPALGALLAYHAAIVGGHGIQGVVALGADVGGGGEDVEEPKGRRVIARVGVI
jgi:hypothetical protein